MEFRISDTFTDSLSKLTGRVARPDVRKGVAMSGLIRNRCNTMMRACAIEIPRATRRFFKNAAPFWQPGGGYDRNVDDINTLRAMIDYFHANAVRRGLVKRPEEWEWSSAGWYAGMQPVRIEMDRTLPMFEE